MVAIFFCVSKKKIKSSGKTTMMRSLSLFGKNNDKLIEDGSTILDRINKRKAALQNFV